MSTTKDFVKRIEEEIQDMSQLTEQLEQPEDLKASLRDYQLEGLRWIANLYLHNRNGILADEMGLGKTLQTISFILYLKNTLGVKGPYLIVCPLSIYDTWRGEIQNFAPSLGIFEYIGNKEERQLLRDNLVDFVNDLPKTQRSDPPFLFDIFLTTYDLLNMDVEFFHQFKFKFLALDEASKLKSSKSLTYQNLISLKCPHRLLLTGTPIQNNLKELFSLLHFIEPKLFSDEDLFLEAFNFKASSRDQNKVTSLQQVLKPFVLRRVKSEVVPELAEKKEFTMYVGMSALQKKYYKAILCQDISYFETGNRTKLMNVMMQLRKCVNHPYLFDGVEPEPFELGEHLITTSGKLNVLDRLLPYLKRKGHRVLIFSQMTRMLDILQDYLYFRDYSYERLDGSIRGEERYLAIKNFSEDPETFVFLLSTRAGGVGLNLVAADTVIFFDSDFNPQSDLQAAARAHRIGQTKTVQIIRLVCRDTVEEIILSRANQKLKLSTSIMANGIFHQESSESEKPGDLLKILKFGMDQLLESVGDDKVLTDEDFDMIFSTTASDLNLSDDADSEDEFQDNSKSMYIYKGEDFSKKKEKKKEKRKKKLLKGEEEGEEDFENEMDDIAYQKLLQEVKDKSLSISSPTTVKTRQHRQVNSEELEVLKQDAELRKVKQKEENERKKEQKRQEKWKQNGYQSSSLSLPSDDEDAQNESDEEDFTSSHEELIEKNEAMSAINFISGDVTKPHPVPGYTTQIIVNAVDNSGFWGSGGVFSALDRVSPLFGAKYEQAGQNDDLLLGSVHLEKLEELDPEASKNYEDQKYWVAHLIAQKRDKKTNQASGIQIPSLDEGFRKIAFEAQKSKASVHFPRIGQRTPNFNWYGTERLIRKYFSAKGIPTYVYYFSRNQKPKQPQRPQISDSEEEDSKVQQKDKKRQNEEEEDQETNTKRLKENPLLDIFTGCVIYFHNISEDQINYFTRRIIAYDGEVIDKLSNRITHIVSENVEDLKPSLVDLSAIVVSPLWLTDCLEAKTLLNTEPYCPNF